MSKKTKKDLHTAILFSFLLLFFMDTTAFQPQMVFFTWNPLNTSGESLSQVIIRTIVDHVRGYGRIQT